MAVKQSMRILGFMTGTSLDAVDMAVLETDGEEIVGFGPAGERKMSGHTRDAILAATADALAWPWDAERPASFEVADNFIVLEHCAAAEGFMADNDLLREDIDFIGFHGQTVLHQPPGPDRAVGRTVQLGDGALLARNLDLPVIYDFRSDDVAAGGQGAPLAPIYHEALVRWSGFHTPCAVLNLGGVGNVTLIKADGGLEAFDTGPANGMIDLLMQARTDRRYDHDGAAARAGFVDEAILEAYLAHPYFARTGPKSLDRYDFTLDAVAGLSLEDAAATLTAFAAEAVSRGVRAAAKNPPLRLVVCGGGRLNPVLIAAIQQRLVLPVITAEDAHWRGDSIEAEACAYLAARSVMDLPISFPGTTGVPCPMSGGRGARP
jgi:anhydro-N-acetylmuramic acid kinase